MYSVPLAVQYPSRAIRSLHDARWLDKGRLGTSETFEPKLFDGPSM
jgi:hypothetical protein